MRQVDFSLQTYGICSVATTVVNNMITTVSISPPIKRAETLGTVLAVQLGLRDQAEVDLLDLAGGRLLGFVCPEDQPRRWLEPAIAPFTALAAVAECLVPHAPPALLLPIEGRDLACALAQVLPYGPVVLGPLRASLLVPDPWASFHEGAATFATVVAQAGRTGLATLHLPSAWPLRRVCLPLLERAVRESPHPAGIARLFPLTGDSWRLGPWRRIWERLGNAPWAQGATALGRVALGFSQKKQGRRQLPALHVGLRNLHQALTLAARIVGHPPVSVSEDDRQTAKRQAVWLATGGRACAELLADLPSRTPDQLAEGLGHIAAWAEVPCS